MTSIPASLNQRKIEIEQQIRRLPCIAAILKRLRYELPADLTYHNYHHTDEVISEAALFAANDQLPEKEYLLLGIAAAFHDAGFLRSSVDNEVIGARIARTALEQAGGYSESDIRLVERMILDTRMLKTVSGSRQVATTDLSRYLLDADLGNLGRDDYFEKVDQLRRELRHDLDAFERRAYRLLLNHRWHSPAAEALRSHGQAQNIVSLRTRIESRSGAISPAPGGVAVEVKAARPSIFGGDRLEFLARLPMLLNSSLGTRQVMRVALEHAKLKLDAEAATIFLLDDSQRELTFWAIEGGGAVALEGRKMPADKGIVGWTISRQEAVIANDVSNDQRFFGRIDTETKFITKSILSVPLTVRGERPIGAIQVLNRHVGKDGNSKFSDEDLAFLDQFAHHVALAIDNARLVESLSERNRKLEVLDRRKNDMVTLLAHEIRTPVNIVQSAAEMLSSGALRDRESIDQMTTTLMNGVRRLTRLASDVRNISFVSAQSVTIDQAPFDVSELLQELQAQYAPVCSARKLNFQVNAPQKGVRAQGDEALLRVALGNLISNGIRFTPDGGNIVLAASNSGDTILFAVKDSGVGITPDDLPYIFEKFYEVGDVMQHRSGDYAFKAGGLGLGLATARAIVSSHGATLEVESAPGKGTTFRFSLSQV